MVFFVIVVVALIAILLFLFYSCLQFLFLCPFQSIVSSLFFLSFVRDPYFPAEFLSVLPTSLFLSSPLTFLLSSVLFLPPPHPLPNKTKLRIVSWLTSGLQLYLSFLFILDFPHFAFPSFHLPAFPFLWRITFFPISLFFFLSSSLLSPSLFPPIQSTK